MNELDLAIADFTKAIDLPPGDAGLRVGRGDARVKAGRVMEGIDDYTRAYDLGGSAYALRQRGRAFELIGRFDDAKADLERFSTTSPGDAEVADALRRIESVKEARFKVPDRKLDAALVLDDGDHARSVTDTASPRQPVPFPDNATEKRIALVVGNSTYSAVPTLANPSGDATKVADELTREGFQVTLEKDVTRERFVNALAKFSVEAETADWALLYYAGHGIEIGGENYLIPVDASLATDRAVPFEAIPLTQAKGAVDGARRLKLVIVDACRANPFANRIRVASASRAPTRGLARPPEYEPGTLIVYAAKEGEVASDGSDRGNSPFAAALIKEMQVPGVEVRRLFDLVRDDVIEATGNNQHPFTYGSLSGRQDFFFTAANSPDRQAARDPNPLAVAAPPFIAPPVPSQPTVSRSTLPMGSASISPAQGGLWDHNGSIVSLAADGNRRTFLYVEPRVGLTALGVHTGTVLFDGERQGDLYFGTAYLFNPGCAPKCYDVEGSVSNNQRVVTLRGKAPRLDARCAVTGTRDDTLVFMLEGE